MIVGLAGVLTQPTLPSALFPQKMFAMLDNFSLLALDHFGWGLSGLYTCVALGIVAFSAVLAFSTTRRAWTGRA
ncbi:MAG: hypothetical protein J0M17_15040 [Planctomycetes bacterium]|nr:hypothetical protein [Planctomycetota bacterium]